MSAEPPSSPFDAFFSYNSEDKAFVERIVEALEKEYGFNIWWDDKKMISGDIIEKNIEEAINHSRTCVIFLGPSDYGEWQEKEIQWAINKKIKDSRFRIIPVILPGVSLDSSKSKWRSIIELHSWVKFSTSVDEPEKLEQLARGIKNEGNSEQQEEKDEAHFPFVNQAHVIDNILPSHPNQRYLIDAPAGCGKTALLKELKRRFEDEEQSPLTCIYVSVGAEDESAREIIKQFFQALKGEPRSDNIKDWGGELAGLMIKEKKKNKNIYGFVFLIDLCEKTSSKLLKSLIDDFIPEVQKNLNTDDSFNKDPNLFRVILAGRYLAGHEVVKSALHYKVFQLLPFTSQHLHETATKYLKGWAPDAVEKISTIVMHLSGGHLGCIASLLKLYKNSFHRVPEKFLNRSKEEIEEKINSEIEKIQAGVPKNLEDIINSTGIFRKANHHILDYIRTKKNFAEYKDGYDLGDKLIEHYLFGNEGIFLLNHHHRILALHLRQDPSNPELAQEACLSYLTRKKPIPYEVESWAIEYLYYYLQSQFNRINDRQERKSIRQYFFDVEVPKILHVIVEDRDQNDVRQLLLQKMKKDEEFQFTLNYYLREDQYNASPYESLITRINTLFEKIH